MLGSAGVFFRRTSISSANRTAAAGNLWYISLILYAGVNRSAWFEVLVHLGANISSKPSPMWFQVLEIFPGGLREFTVTFLRDSTFVVCWSTMMETWSELMAVTVD